MKKSSFTFIPNANDVLSRDIYAPGHTKQNCWLPSTLYQQWIVVPQSGELYPTTISLVGTIIVRKEWS